MGVVSTNTGSVVWFVGDVGNVRCHRQTHKNLLETAEYKNTLKSICEKRFTMFFDQLEQRPECSTDIEFYLGNYSIDCELARFENRTLKFKESLERIIWTLSKDEEEFQYYYDTLCNEAPLLNARMHQALLLRSSNYRPTLSELTSCFLDWKTIFYKGIMPSERI